MPSTCGQIPPGKYSPALPCLGLTPASAFSCWMGPAVVMQSGLKWTQSASQEAEAKYPQLREAEGHLQMRCWGPRARILPALCAPLLLVINCSSCTTLKSYRFSLRSNNFQAACYLLAEFPLSSLNSEGTKRGNLDKKKTEKAPSVHVLFIACHLQLRHSCTRGCSGWSYVCEWGRGACKSAPVALRLGVNEWGGSVGQCHGSDSCRQCFDKPRCIQSVL